ncbi:MAG TPA: hypothetical protein VKX17_23595 [Planctomycetota bacterium]|nr:hypothetical protein [Planctomycetota bacterium]
MRMRFFAMALALALSAARAEDTAKAPIPTPDQQRASERIIRDLFKDEFAKTAPKDKLELARTLSTSADETKDDNSARYVLWLKAMDLAAQAGDLEMLFFLYSKLTANFEGESKDEMKIHLAMLSNNTRDGMLSKVAMAFRTLLDKPDDALAALTAGRYLCFARGDFANGVVLLAKSQHPGLNAVAHLELEAPEDDAAKQMKLADNWWDLAEKSGDKDERMQFQQRATYWYERVLPNESGLNKIKIEKRIAQYQAAGGAKPVAAALLKPAEPKLKPVNLLKQIDVLRDIVKGDWSVENGVLASKYSDREQTLQLPIHPGNCYDFHADFMNTTQKGDTGIILAHSGQQVWLSLSGWDNTGVGLTLIDGRMATDNSTWAKSTIEHNVRHDVLVQVRPKSIRALLDGIEIVNFEFTTANFSLLSYLRIRDKLAVGLGCWFQSTQFHTIELTEFNPAKIVPATDRFVGRWDAEHPLYKSAINFKPDGTCVMDTRRINGKWELQGNALTITWDHLFGPEKLQSIDINTFTGKDEFVLKRATKVKQQE